MPRPQMVRVRDRETGHEYEVSQARYRRTPDLWDRPDSVPAKPRTSVDEAAKKKKNSGGGSAASTQEDDG